MGTSLRRKIAADYARSLGRLVADARPAQPAMAAAMSALFRCSVLAVGCLLAAGGVAAGSREDDESLFATACREAREETGIDTTVAALWGEERMWYLGEQLFLKENGFSRRTPWHQDTSYLRMMGSQLVACWVSLDPLAKEPLGLWAMNP